MQGLPPCDRAVAAPTLAITVYNITNYSAANTACYMLTYSKFYFYTGKAALSVAGNNEQTAKISSEK